MSISILRIKGLPDISEFISAQLGLGSSYVEEVHEVLELGVQLRVRVLSVHGSLPQEVHISGTDTAIRD